MRRLLILLIFFLLIPIQAQEGIQITEFATLGRGTASTLDWRPDGEILAVGGSAGLWLFNPDFEQIAHWNAGQVRYIEWSPAGDNIALSYEDGNVEVWMIEDDGTEADKFWQIIENAQFAPEISWSPSGEQLSIVDSSLQEATIWNIPSTGRNTGFRIENVYGRLDWSSDGRWLTGKHDTYDSIGLWDASTGELIRKMTGIEPQLFFTDVLFSPDSRRIIAGSSLPASIHIWNLETGEILNESNLYLGEDGIYRAIKWHPFDESTFVVSGRHVGGSGYFLNVMNESASELSSYTGLNSFLRALDWMPNGTTITILDSHGAIYQWHQNGDETTKYQLYMPFLKKLEWSPSSQSVALIGSLKDDGREFPLLIWTNIHESMGAYPDANAIIYPAFSLEWLRWFEDRGQLLTFSNNYFAGVAWCWLSEFQFWDLETSREIEGSIEIDRFEFDQGACGIEGLSAPVNSEPTDDFSAIVSGNSERNIVIVTKNSSIVFEIEDISRLLHLSPDEIRIAVVSTNEHSSDITLEVWDVDSQVQLTHFRLEQWESDVIWRSRIEWSPNSEHIALIVPTVDGSHLFMIDSLTETVLFEQAYPTSIIVDWQADGELISLRYSENLSAEGSRVDVLNSVTGDTLFSIKSENNLSAQWHPQLPLFALTDGQTFQLIDGETGVVLYSDDVNGNGMEWSPDGTMLAVWGEGRLVRLWRVDGLGE